MNNLIATNIIRFIFVVLLQVLVVNQIDFLGYINPMIYIVWIILYPLREKRFAIISLSFLLGLTIDFFSDTGGIHAAASTFIAYIRLPLLKAVLRKSDFDFILFNLRSVNIFKAFIFIGNITLVHHFLVYLLEYFSFNEFGTVLYKSVITTIASVFLIIFGILLFTKKK